MRNTYPRFFRIRQKFASHAIADIDMAIDDVCRGASMSTLIRPGERVAIAVGSRGIANLSTIVAAVVSQVRRVGGVPFIVPAMGSHGGGSADGQAAVLASLGVDDASCGAAVEASMDTIIVGAACGIDVHFDRIASQADHVIVINRIKSHTRLSGLYQSGLIKMLMIGLGKHRGAALYHQIFTDLDNRLDGIAPEIVSLINDTMPITMGIGIVEDAYEQTSLIEAVLPGDFLQREPELRQLADSRMPKLPFDHARLLIVDTIGKEISGAGMDTNVVGRKSNDKVAASDEFPKIREIYVRRLSAKSAGNATGVGIAEYCHRRVVDAMDAQVTRINCITGQHVSAGAVPLVFDNDREVFDAVIAQNNLTPVAQMKWMWIEDTLRLQTIDCSEAYWDEAVRRDDLEITSDPMPLEKLMELKEQNDRPS